MRLSVSTLGQVVKRDLPITFVAQHLTSYGGLELVRRYVPRLELPRRLHAACAGLGSDYGGARLALLLLALPYVGARRLEHLQYLVGDPLVRRFTGLARVPTARTVGNWLRRFTQETLRPLVRLNQDLVLDSLARLNVPRLTLDVDGTIVRTGATVAWAFRGFNPHHRKDRSYYPLLAHVAQTGHILRLKNRPGNVHDSKQSAAFLRALIEAVRGRLGRRVPLEFRMDAAFFQADVLRLLAARGCGYAIKVGYWSWLPLKQLARSAGAGTPWPRASAGSSTRSLVYGLGTRWPIKASFAILGERRERPADHTVSRGPLDQGRIDRRSQWALWSLSDNGTRSHCRLTQAKEVSMKRLAAIVTPGSAMKLCTRTPTASTTPRTEPVRSTAMTREARIPRRAPRHCSTIPEVGTPLLVRKLSSPTLAAMASRLPAPTRFITIPLATITRPAPQQRC